MGRVAVTSCTAIATLRPSPRQQRRTKGSVAARSQQQQQQGEQAAAPLRLLPLIVGAAGFTGVVLNRTLSGVAPVVTASSSQSRADVVAIALAAVLLLTGLQWLALTPRQYEPVTQEGKEMSYLSAELPPAARREIKWLWAALRGATSACSVVVFVRGQCVAHLGVAAPGADPHASAPGPICRQAQTSGTGNYLANLQLFPGRLEFAAYLPDTTQAALVQPLGDEGLGVAVVGSHTQRGFNRLEQAWLAALGDKLGQTLEGWAPAATGFGGR